jgi:hypothetical protein
MIGSGLSEVLNAKADHLAPHDYCSTYRRTKRLKLDERNPYMRHEPILTHIHPTGGQRSWH